MCAFGGEGKEADLTMESKGAALKVWGGQVHTGCFIALIDSSRN